MNKNNWIIKERVKDEYTFAKTVSIRYKMSNTKNKDFVKVVLLDIEEIQQFFNLKKLLKELSLLNFFTINLENNPKYLAVVKENETRKLCYGKILSIKEFLLS